MTSGFAEQVGGRGTRFEGNAAVWGCAVRRKTEMIIPNADRRQYRGIEFKSDGIGRQSQLAPAVAHVSHKNLERRAGPDPLARQVYAIAHRPRETLCLGRKSYRQRIPVREPDLEIRTGHKQR